MLNSRQPYYRWLKCPVSEAEYVEAARANSLIDAHRHDPEYGSRFLAYEIHDAGVSMSKSHRVAELLGESLAERVRQEERPSGTQADPPVHDNLVQRHFSASTPHDRGSATSPSTDEESQLTESRSFT